MLFGTDDNDLRQVWNGGDDSCGKFYFSVCLIDLEDVIASLILFFDEFFHAVVDLVGTQMNLKG
jgi:hypothetical protein